MSYAETGRARGRTKFIVLPLALGALLVAGCGDTRTERALSGGGIGAATGAAAGAVTGGSVGAGAVVGGAVGAATGALTDRSDISLD